MTKLIAGLLASLGLIASAQAQQQLIGSVALSVGQWIVKNSKTVYYVRMEATASTEPDARRQAFAAACEQAIGAVILSERESNPRGITRNDVFNYSSCMVEDYRVVSVNGSSDGVRVVVDVWVSDSKIANRLETMGVGNGTLINGEQIRRDWERDQSKRDADDGGVSLMRRVLDDYPRAAYQTRILETKVTRVNGDLAFSVTIEMKLSSQYLTALSEVVEKTRYSSWNTNAGRGVKIYDGKFTNTAGVWKDSTVQDLWERSLNRPVNMRLTFTGGPNQYTNCWTHDDDWYKTSFNGYYKINGRVNNAFLIVDGTYKKTTTYNLINRRSWGWSEEKFINWVSGFNLIDAKVVDADTCVR